jgi:hypothetical protein
MKLFAGLVPWVLPLAAIASFMFGGLWYGLLSKQWMDAAGLSKERLDANSGQTPRLLVMTFVCQLFMAWMLAGVILHMQKAGIPATLKNGMISGFFIWAGFIMMPLIVNHGYQLARRNLTAIDGVHWLGVMLIQGALIGWLGIAR